MNDNRESLTAVLGAWARRCVAGAWGGLPRRWIAIYTILSAGLASVVAVGVSWRLGVLILILSSLVGLALLLAHVVERYGFPVLELAASATLRWLQERDDRMSRSLHGRLERLGVELPLVAVLAAAVMGGMWLFLGLLEDVVSGDPLVAVDGRVFRMLQVLRSPWGDAGLIALTELGDRVVITAVAIMASMSFLLLRRWRAALYLVVAALGSTLFVHGMKMVLHRSRPLQLYDGISEFSFPSGHATSSIVVYGFLAIMFARSASPALRRGLIAGTLSLIVLIAFSRLYLGAHWMSDVGAGLSFGIAWTAALAILYFRGEREPLPSRFLASLVAATVVVAGVWHISRTHPADMARYAPGTVIPSSKAQPQ